MEPTSSENKSKDINSEDNKSEEKKQESLIKIYKDPHPCNFVYFMKEGSNEMYVQDPKVRPGKLYLFDQVMSNLHDTAFFDNRIFITGGFVKGPIYLDTFHEIILDHKEKKGVFKALPHMIHPRAQHSMTNIGDKFIYCLGGKNKDEGIFESVEKFSFETGQWVETKPMSESKVNMSSITFNERFIYVFGGYNFSTGGVKGTIEFIDTQNENDGWQKYIIPNNAHWTPRYWCGLSQISEDQIVIFGGNNLIDGMILNVPKHSIYKFERSIPYDLNFCLMKSKIIEDRMWIFDYSRKLIHDLKLRELKWDSLDFDQWFYGPKPIDWEEMKRKKKNKFKFAGF